MQAEGEFAVAQAVAHHDIKVAPKAGVYADFAHGHSAYIVITTFGNDSSIRPAVFGDLKKGDFGGKVWADLVRKFAIMKFVLP